MGREVMGNSGWGTHVHPWLIHVNVWEKSQYGKGIASMLCGTLECMLHFALPFLVFYLVYTWGTQASEKSKRKNPAVYANDK
uniref:Cytochrome b-c1 complex subunit 8 n=1 Tax=Bos indicus x Bos taurus TaxID=30522 RepID=A0A4W2CWW1_BOBOX